MKNSVNINTIKQAGYTLSAKKAIEADKIDDALSAIIDFVELKPDRAGYYSTPWGRKTKLGLKESILTKLREYGVVMKEEDI